MAATYQLGYRIGLLAAGAGALSLAELWSWQLAYVVMAAFMLVGIATVLLIREPESRRQAGPILQDEQVVAFMAGRPHLSERQRPPVRWHHGTGPRPFRAFF